MLKQFMTWLLNQFQKVISVFTKGPKKAKSNQTSAIANRLSNDISSQRQTDSSDAPVAIRDTPTSQTPASVEPDSAISPEKAAADTHQRVDIAPAALPEEAITEPSFPTEVSALISSPNDSQLPTGTLNPQLSEPQPLNTPTYSDEQPPEIHDLLPAIEPKQPEETEQPIEPETDLSNETADSLTASTQQPSNVSQAEQQNTAIAQPVVESARRVSKQTDEEVTLFSFNITESEESAEPSVDTQPPNMVQNVVQTETDQTENIPDQTESIPEETAESIPEEATESTPEETVETTVVNPWLIAVPPQQQTTSSADAPTTSPPKDKTALEKAGTVKLLFTLKEGNFHGYITPHDGSKDILFHQKYINAEIFDHIERGSEVIADIKYMEGKVYATHVRLQ